MVKIIKKTFIYIILTILAVIIILPFVIMFLGSFREHVDIIIRGPLSLPESWDFGNFKTVLFEYDYLLYIKNTIIITAPTVLISLFFAILSAYALTFMDFKYKSLLTFFTTVIGIMIAAEFIMIPLYRFLSGFELIDTYVGVMLPQIAMSACFSTMVLRSFFGGLPRELVDGAVVDGASSWQIVWKILVPIARPSVITAAALTTVWTWNSYIIPLVLL